MSLGRPPRVHHPEDPPPRTGSSEIEDCSQAILRLSEALRAHRLLTAESGDGTAKLWPVRFEDLISLAEARSPRELTAPEREQYRDLLHD